jgi:hypothetical protein
MDYVRAKRSVSSSDKIELTLAPGGGFAGRLSRE